MRRHIATITDVAERHLCTGCGACAYAQPDDIAMVDDLDAGRRPVVRPGAATAVALDTCPGVGLGHPDDHGPGVIDELVGAWGPVLEVWEGHATDPAIRWAGSSGGAATALALHGIEHEAMHGALHVRQRPGDPLRNEAVLGRSRDELLAGAGSRYAPASPCERLDLVAEAPSPCVVIGKPCDIAAVAKLRLHDRRLAQNVGVTIAIFCAGTPSARGTRELVERFGFAPDEVRSVRYRGNGWPGRATVEAERDGERHEQSMSYAESWGSILQRHRQWRCHVCADHTGEFADLAVGDPWYRDIGPDEPGSSLILVRTRRGRELLERAVASGVLEVTPLAARRLVDAQPNLLDTRGALWGRLATLRVLGIAAPRYRNMATFPIWWSHLSPVAKLRSVTGTARRVVRKRLHRRRPVRPE
ncbi:MAG: Coenzyme F420 hydrogenase/dehydrogenase, beta subunit C-terminal domain [Actinomycetota bacterium]|nr:Coenzyme F420 hydrogenase/dehydrogenase, beta subunit C-terminal domain [Actinomycetota bacterium]